jgi:hypothetical protein
MSALPVWAELGRNRASQIQRELQVFQPHLAEALAAEFRVSPLFIRTMWGTITAELTERGSGPEELVSACRALIDLIDANLKVCEEVGGRLTAEQRAELTDTANDLRGVRQRAAEWLRVATAPSPPMDWARVDELLQSGGQGEEVQEVIERVKAGREP